MEENLAFMKHKTVLVLSGGTKGIAHPGVVKALYEAGESFDIIISTSTGAATGYILTGQQNPDDILNFNKAPVVFERGYTNIRNILLKG